MENNLKLSGQDETETQMNAVENFALNGQAFLDPTIVEALAEYNHIQWMEWVTDAVEAGIMTEEGKRTEEEKMVPYAELSAEAKEYNREWAVGAGKIVIAAFLTGRVHQPIQEENA